jgi:hypothetical protein
MMALAKYGTAVQVVSGWAVPHFTAVLGLSQGRRATGGRFILRLC